MMAQFIELMVPGGTSVFIRCASIERVEAPGNLTADQIAPPEVPIKLVFRDGKERLSAYGCSVLDILHGIHRDDVFLDSRGSDEGRHAV